MKVLTAPIVAMLVFAAFVGPTTAPIGAVTTLPTEPGVEDTFVTRINAARAEAGVEPLRRDGNLIVAAREWARWMGERRELRHADDIVTGAPADWTKAGENVGRGSALDAIWDAFMASPSHAANVLDPAFTRIGVGAVHTPDGVIYTTHRFAGAVSDRTAPPPEPATEPVLTPTPEPDPAPIEPDTPPVELVFADDAAADGAARAVDPVRLESRMRLILAASD